MLETAHHDEIYAAEQLERRARKFVAKFSLLVVWKMLRAKCGAQKNLKIFHRKMVVNRNKDRIWTAFEKMRKWWTGVANLRARSRAVTNSTIVRQMMLKWKIEYVASRKSGIHEVSERSERAFWKTRKYEPL